MKKVSRRSLYLLQRGSRLTDKAEPRVSLWCVYDLTQYREQLEKQSDDEQQETVHRERKRSIRRWLTPSPALRRFEFGAQDEEKSGIPRTMLDIVVELIFGALSERPQRGGTLHHFPQTQDHNFDEIEEQANDKKALHSRPASRDVLVTTGFPCAVP